MAVIVTRPCVSCGALTATPLCRTCAEAQEQPPTERPVIITARDARVTAEALEFCMRISALMLEEGILQAPVGRGELERVTKTLREQL